MFGSIMSFAHTRSTAAADAEDGREPHPDPNLRHRLNRSRSIARGTSRGSAPNAGAPRAAGPSGLQRWSLQSTVRLV